VIGKSSTNGKNVSMIVPLRMARRRLASRAVAVGALAAMGLAVAAGPALAEFGLRLSPSNPAIADFTADAFDESGGPFTQAGGYPFEARTAFEFNTVGDGRGSRMPEGNPKDIVIDLPAGLVGNPQAAATCETEQFMEWAPSGLNYCPVDSQIGVVRLELYNNGDWTYTTPIYNMRPSRSEIAAFQFNAITVPVRAVPVVRSNGDYGLRVNVTNINETVGIKRVEFALWGVPASPAHDRYRSYIQMLQGGTPVATIGGNVSSSITPKPFFINPATCAHGPYTTTLRTHSWQNPGDWLTYSVPSMSGVTGCSNLKWEPTIDVKPDTTQAGAPTGMHVDLNVPQHDNPNVPATPPLKKAIVRLPEGVRVSPSASDGLGACSDAQIALDSTDRPTCPSSSNIGTVSIDTPLLAEPLRGSIFLGEQRPEQLLRLFIVAEGRGNLILKLPGKVDPDPVTGQLLATFDDNPQLPFSKLSLYFKGGPRASLTNPSTCGVKTTTTELSAWSGQVAQPGSSFVIDRGADGGACAPLGFTPSFSAGSDNANGGGDASFTVTFGRDDADQELKDVAVALPPGLLARIASVDLCQEAQAATGTCGEDSRIGSVTTAAGPGTSPFYLPGRVHITGPYKGGPFGLSIVVPARAGPFDLGTVVVRAAIHVDRRTAELSIVSDPLPSILLGIPLQIRSVNIKVDRPNFMFNPTSCNPMSIRGRLGSTAGATAEVSSRFQVANCGSLPFKPKMAIKMGAKGRTKAGITAPLDVSLAMTPGQANNRSVSVSLPRNVNARLTVINERACTLAQFESATCPSSNRIGVAKAVTPLLRDPLVGDAFFVRNPSRRIPDLMVALRGQVDIDLTGKVTVNRNLTLRTDFDTIPDVPISTFSLNLVAGKNGAVGFVENACTKAAKAERATIRFRAHNGRLVRVEQKLQIAGCKAARKPAKKKPAAKKR
jgi:hypothetical protein